MPSTASPARYKAAVTPDGALGGGGVSVVEHPGRNAKLNTNHINHLGYLLHFSLLGPFVQTHSLPFNYAFN